MERGQLTCAGLHSVANWLWKWLVMRGGDFTRMNRRVNACPGNRGWRKTRITPFWSQIGRQSASTQQVGSGQRGDLLSTSGATDPLLRLPGLRGSGDGKAPPGGRARRSRHELEARGRGAAQHYRTSSAKALPLSTTRERAAQFARKANVGQMRHGRRRVHGTTRPHTGDIAWDRGPPQILADTGQLTAIRLDPKGSRACIGIVDSACAALHAYRESVDSARLVRMIETVPARGMRDSA